MLLFNLGSRQTLQLRWGFQEVHFTVGVFVRCFIHPRLCLPDNSLIHSLHYFFTKFTHLFICHIIHSFSHPHAFIHLLVQAFIQCSFAHLLTMYILVQFLQSALYLSTSFFTLLPAHLVTRSLTSAFIHSFVHFSTHSVHSFIHSLSFLMHPFHQEASFFTSPRFLCVPDKEFLLHEMSLKMRRMEQRGQAGNIIP